MQPRASLGLFPVDISRNWVLLTSEMCSLCAMPLRGSLPLLGKGPLHHQGEWEGREGASLDPGAAGPTVAHKDMAGSSKLPTASALENLSL